jgi:cytoskeleton protein RodZ
MKQQKELIPMATGECLKQRRLERKLSLAEVSQAIRLDESLLDDVEQERMDHIAMVYRTGYIQTYARYLQIPEEDIQILLSSVDRKVPEIRNIFSKPPRHNLTDKWLRATSYVLASLLIGTLAWQFTHEAVRLSQSGSQLHTGEENVKNLNSTTDRGLTASVTGPVNASISPLGVLHDNEVDGLDTAEQAWAALSRPALPEGESRLQLSVSADSWVEIVDADGEELEMDLLRAGTDKNYHGKSPFRILFGHAPAVRLSIDGEPVDLTAYTRENVAHFTWPQKLQIDKDEPTNN